MHVGGDSRKYVDMSKCQEWGYSHMNRVKVSQPKESRSRYSDCHGIGKSPAHSREQHRELKSELELNWLFFLTSTLLALSIKASLNS